MTVAYPAGKAEFDENAPASVADGVVGYRAGGQVWKWTATFEAFVSWMPLVDPQGNVYEATPAGTYRFVVHGKWRQGGADADYERISDEFEVRPWSGITAENAKIDGGGHVTFDAGPTATIEERVVEQGDGDRATARPPLAPDNAPIPFEIGPINFPDTAKDPAATGARFLKPDRGYSGTSLTEVEHYCLNCSFRPWLDAAPAHARRPSRSRRPRAAARRRRSSPTPPACSSRRAR